MLKQFLYSIPVALVLLTGAVSGAYAEDADPPPDDGGGDTGGTGGTGGTGDTGGGFECNTFYESLLPGRYCDDGNGNPGMSADSSCEPTNGMTYYCENGTPEMSDYLAAAFVIAAGAVVFYIRRRSNTAAV